MEYRRQAHAVYYMRYHVVISAKYRRAVLRGGVGQYVEKLVLQVSRVHPDWEVFEANTDVDHPAVALIFNINERTLRRWVLRWLHEHDFRLKVPQPWPDRQDEQLRTAWLQELRTLLSDENVDLWYGDEMGVEGDPRPRRRWAKKGEKARITKNGDHLRMNVCGAVCPRTGQFYALEFTHSNRAAFQAYLDHASADMTFQRKRNILIVDNASWHKSATLNWGAFEPLYLPPYSPDLNPIERLWLVIKAEWFTDFIAKDRDALIERLDKALLWAMDRTHNNKRTCNNRKNL
jgi:transposase/REP element-mobilizing transposase RayT